MFQPFIEFKPGLVDRFEALGKYFFVCQSYPRGSQHNNDEGKIGILMSDYGDRGLSEGHYKAVRKENDKTAEVDKYAYILDIRIAAHKAKLLEMLQPDSKYKVYWAAVLHPEKLKRRLDTRFSQSIKRWIAKNTSWNIGRNEKIISKLLVIYGELYIALNRNGVEKMQIKFSEIEKT